MTSVLLRTLLIFVALPVTVALLTGAKLWLLFGALLSYLLVVGWGARDAAAVGRRRFDLTGGAFMLVLFFALPIGLASVTGARWTTIGWAYLIWFSLLGLWMVQGLLSRGVRSGAAVGWPFLMGMFLTMGAVPVLSLVLRLAGAG